MSDESADAGYRDRILDLRRVRAGDLVPDDRNWRVHPEEQAAALRTMMERIGVYDAVIAREDEDGRLVLVDGHLRAGMDPDAVIPVLVVDLDAAEAGEAIATHDPLAGMADADTDLLGKLIRQIDGGSELAAQMFDEDTNALLAAEDGDWPTDIGRHQPLVEMTFTVSESQRVHIEAALRRAKKSGMSPSRPDPDNENTNGNILAAWAETSDTMQMDHQDDDG